MNADFADSSAEERSKPPDPSKVGRGAATLWVAATALNLWVVAVLMPILLARPSSPGEFVSGAFVLLGAAGAAHGVGRDLRWPALVGYPSLVLLHLLAGFGAETGVALVAAAAAMVAYIVVASSFATRPRWRLVTVRSLGERLPNRERFRRARLRRLVTGVIGLASFGIGVVVPALAFDDESWSDAARPAARATVAVFAGIAATLMLAAFAGPAARRRRPGAVSPQRKRKRVAMLLTVALFGVAIALVISR